jgi:DNA segregation ATPase FtsK/SpoIIIE, S-DNA-T family
MSSFFDDNDPLRSFEQLPAESAPVAEETELAAVESEEPSPDEPKTTRDVQRGALQQLVDLVGECAALETEIEKQHDHAAAEAKSGSQLSKSTTEKEYASYQKKIADKCAEQTAAIEGRYKQNASTLKAHDQKTRGRTKDEFESAQAQIKKEYEHGLWIAESVLEAAEGKVAEELKKATELNAAQNEHLDHQQAEVTVLMNRYNQGTPTGADLAAIKEAEATPDPILSYNRHKEVIDKQLVELGSIGVAKLFAGGTAYILGFLLVLVGAGAGQAITMSTTPNFQDIGIGAGAGLVVAIVLLVLLKSIAKKRVYAAYKPLQHAMDSARVANENMLIQAQAERDRNLLEARRQQKGESTVARDRATPQLEKATKKRDAALQALQTELAAKNAENEKQRKTATAQLEQWRTVKLEEVRKRYEGESVKVATLSTQLVSQIQSSYEAERKALEDRWTTGLKNIQEPIAENGGSYPAWSDAVWDHWKYPTKFPPTLRFGEIQVDLKSIVDEVAVGSRFTLPLPDLFTVPALITYPKQGSVLIHTDRQGRADAIKAVQMIMTRLMTCLPPGRVRFTMLDPVGLGQNFSGFMTLGDYDELLVNSKIWTDADQIDQRLANLTEHMETVIQKYLRNEFATIDEYNAQAGELAEPYRYLVIADFPTNFSDESLRRLSSIATTGARCGVYTLIMRDTRVNTGTSVHLDDIEAHSVNLVREGDRFVWRDPVFSRFPLTLDPAPADNDLIKLVHLVGKGAREAKRVEVAFDLIAPKQTQYWTLKSDGDMRVAVGRSGATRVQMFTLGRGVAQHALVAGKTGSGKSTLLHALISNLAMWYSPDEIELYLIDFKKGVEFKTYAMHALPHARAIAVESDREFGLSVLHRIDQEMTRRSELFRPFKAQNLQMYRESSGQKMPRTLLVIDEFQEFFSEDDKLAQDANLLLERIVRQGRAFGVHLLLGSQTIGGSSGLSRATIGQIGVRIALMTSEADSQMILGDGNSAARLLSRPGEAIYNDANGAVEGNSPFQVAWLPDAKRDEYLDHVSEKARAHPNGMPPPIVFEGNEPADYKTNQQMMAMLSAKKYEPLTGPPLLWLGEPVAIKAPTSIPMRRNSGSNVLIVGQNEEGALAMSAISMIGLAAQLSPKDAKFYLLDGTPTDGAFFGLLPSVAAVLPHEVHNVEYRLTADAVHELAEEMKRRQAGDAGSFASIFVIIFGLQRFRPLRKSEDSFSFGGGDEEAKADPGKEFADLLREGPANGIHFISWIDTATALDRTIDRSGMRELDNRVLFQMSATDSSNLIDSPMANKLGANRALAYSEEQGSMEKFRPYAIPSPKWLEELKVTLKGKKE